MPLDTQVTQLWNSPRQQAGKMNPPQETPRNDPMYCPSGATNNRQTRACCPPCSPTPTPPHIHCVPHHNTPPQLAPGSSNPDHLRLASPTLLPLVRGGDGEWIEEVERAVQAANAEAMPCESAGRLARSVYHSWVGYPRPKGCYAVACWTQSVTFGGGRGAGRAHSRGRARGRSVAST